MSGKEKESTVDPVIIPGEGKDNMVMEMKKTVADGSSSEIRNIICLDCTFTEDLYTNKQIEKGERPSSNQRHEKMCAKGEKARCLFLLDKVVITNFKKGSPVYKKTYIRNYADVVDCINLDSFVPVTLEAAKGRIASTGESVWRLMLGKKQDGVSPFYICFTEKVLIEYNSKAKVKPLLQAHQLSHDHVHEPVCAPPPPQNSMSAYLPWYQSPFTNAASAYAPPPPPATNVPQMSQPPQDDLLAQFPQMLLPSVCFDQHQPPLTNAASAYPPPPPPPPPPATNVPPEPPRQHGGMQQQQKSMEDYAERQDGQNLPDPPAANNEQ